MRYRAGSMRPFVVASLLAALGCGGTELITTDTSDGGRALEADSSYDATTDAGSVSTPCIPGQSVACVGPGGCSSNQVCKDDGSAFGPCDCAQPVESGTLDGPNTLAEASTSPESGTMPFCSPGRSIACAGPGGCISNQVCNAQGTGYGACTCSDDGSAPVCIPGQSIACTGPGGCFSNQVCDGDGKAYGPCVCSDAGSVECETPNDCGNLLGPPPPECVMCPNTQTGCAHWDCVLGICQTVYCD
jgi:hypothetical protein